MGDSVNRTCQARLDAQPDKRGLVMGLWMTCRETSAMAAARVTLPSDRWSRSRMYSTSKRLMASRRAFLKERTCDTETGSFAASSPWKWGSAPVEKTRLLSMLPLDAEGGSKKASRQNANPLPRRSVPSYVENMLTCADSGRADER